MFPLIVLCLASALGGLQTQKVLAATGLNGRSSNTHNQSSPDATLLKNGDVLEKEFKGTDAHLFELQVSEGSATEVVVTRRGIDLIVSASLGNDVVELSNPAGPYSKISLTLRADVTSQYHLKVKSAERWAAPASYEIRVSAARTSTPRDVVIQKAQLASSEAWKSQALQTAASRSLAIQKYNEAMKLWEELGSDYERANTLHALARIYKSIGDFEKAKQFYKLACESRTHMDDNTALAYTLNDLAATFRDLGDPEEAIPLYQQSLGIFRDLRNARGEASSLYGIGFVRALQGNIAEALHYYDAVLKIRRAERDRHGEARTLNAMGGAQDILGEPIMAKDLYMQALPLWRTIGDRANEANTLNNIGKLEDTLFEWESAQIHYSQARLIYESIPNPDVATRRKLADLTDNIAFSYLAIGELDQAVRTYEGNLTLRRELKEPRGEGFTEASLGYAYFLSGNVNEAMVHYERALPLQRSVKDPRIAQTYTVVGMVHVSRNEIERGLKYYHDALAVQQNPTSRDAQGEANTLEKMGEAFALLGDLSKARDNYLKALDLSRKIRDPNVEALAQFSLAKLEQSAGRLIEANEHIDNAIKIIESLRTNILSRRLRLSYFSLKNDFYGLGIDIKMAGGSEAAIAAAFSLSERARGRNLIDMLAEARIEAPGLSPDLVSREKQMRQRLNAKASRLTQLLLEHAPQDQIARVNRDIAELTGQYDKLEASIKAKNSPYIALTRVEPMSLKEIQTELDDQQLLLEYALGEKRSYVWVLTRDSVAAFDLPPREQIEAVARRVVRALTARNREEPGETFQQRIARENQADKDYLIAANELSALIIEPVAATLGQKRLVIVPDGALQFIPFAALPLLKAARSPNSTAIAQTLIDQHEIVSLPSASVLILQRRELANRQAAPHSIAILADPVFDAQDQRVLAAANRLRKGVTASSQKGQTVKELPASSTKSNETLVNALRDIGLNADGKLRRLSKSRGEAIDISRLVPQNEALTALDFKASRETVLSGELSKYRYVHFATHGVLSLEHPELSGIALSMVDEKGQKQDGYVRLYEIYNLNLPAELVVLSACETGVGKQIRGEGLIALTRGFMYAGAKRVVASLWKVDDSATAALMTHFYKEMFTNDKRPAEALQSAQIHISRQKRWQSAYYWAGFVLQGEWR